MGQLRAVINDKSHCLAGPGVVRLPLATRATFCYLDYIGGITCQAPPAERAHNLLPPDLEDRRERNGAGPTEASSVGVHARCDLQRARRAFALLSTASRRRWSIVGKPSKATARRLRELMLFLRGACFRGSWLRRRGRPACRHSVPHGPVVSPSPGPRRRTFSSR
jgi:hypothetical protein